MQKKVPRPIKKVNTEKTKYKSLIKDKLPNFKINLAELKNKAEIRRSSKK